MIMGIILKDCSAIKEIERILSIVCKSGRNYCWFINDEEVYLVDEPYTLQKEYQGKKIIDAFSEKEGMIIVTLAIYGSTSPMSQEDFHNRISQVSVNNITSDEIFIYVCDNDWIEVYSKDITIIRNVSNVMRGDGLRVQDISESDCNRRVWNCC